AMMSNDNNVHDWLPDTYDETQDFSWFQQHFSNETFVLVSWDGCTLDDPRLELFAKKIVPPAGEQPVDAGFVKKPEPPKPKWYDDLFFSALFRRPEMDKQALEARGPLFKHVDTGPRLLNRLLEPPISLSEKEAIKRL